jgi:hypothetical protein
VGRAGLYQALLDWAVAACTREAVRPANLLRLAARVACQSPALLRLAVPGAASRAAWSEFRNKADAFRLFATAGAVLGAGAGNAPDLPAAVRRTAGLEPYAGLWTTEGLGFFYASAALGRAGRPSRLLSDGRLPARSLVPLHTGVGLALALAALPGITDPAAPERVGPGLAGYVGLCRNNARPGFAGAVLEALGLVAQLVRPGWVDRLDRELTARHPDLVGLFWHGVGRGLYFAPARVLPCGNVVWPGARTAATRPPHPRARDNAVAGFAWAVTLVNARDPDALGALLRRHGGAIARTDAFAHGTAAAAAVWRTWAPHAGGLGDLGRAGPGAAADRPDELFQYQRGGPRPAGGGRGLSQTT